MPIARAGKMEVIIERNSLFVKWIVCMHTKALHWFSTLEESRFIDVTFFVVSFNKEEVRNEEQECFLFQLNPPPVTNPHLITFYNSSSGCVWGRLMELFVNKRSPSFPFPILSLWLIWWQQWWVPLRLNEVYPACLCSLVEKSINT